MKNKTLIDKLEKEEKILLVVMFLAIIYLIPFSILELKSVSWEDSQPSKYFTEQDFPNTPSKITMFSDGINIKNDNEKLEIGQATSSGSMLPTIPKGSLLILAPILEGELIIGDIVVFNQGNEKVSHRIIRINNGRYTTKGDNNNFEDSQKRVIEEFKFKVVGVLW